jgi:predicted nucleotidyltransferase component of viral defense system
MLSFEQIISLYPANMKPFGRSMLREYLQYKILEAVFNSKYSSKLVFIGETALRIIYENSRFSEDVDFDNFGLTEAEFKELSKEIKKKLELEGYRVEIRQIYKKAFHCYVRFPDILYENKLSPHKQEKILVQMDTLSQGFDYQPERKMLNKFDVFTHIKSASLDLLLSQKLLAALERKRAKGRDFYDVVFLLSKTRPNYSYLKQKLNITNAQSLKKTMIERYEELDFKQLANDVRPFLFFEKDTKKVEQFKEFWEQVSL